MTLIKVKNNQAIDSWMSIQSLRIAYAKDLVLVSSQEFVEFCLKISGRQDRKNARRKGDGSKCLEGMVMCSFDGRKIRGRID